MTTVEAGYCSLVELERLTKELAFLATLYNARGDFARHRTVNLVRYEGVGWVWTFSPKKTEYALIENVSLFSIETVKVGKLLKIVR